MSGQGGTPVRLVAVDEKKEAAHGPQLLPGGRAVLFTLATAGSEWNEAQIVVQSLDSGERKVVLRGGRDARYVETGHLVYARSGTLLAVPFDLDRLEVIGGPVPVVEGVRDAAVERRERRTSACRVMEPWSMFQGTRLKQLNARWCGSAATEQSSLWPPRREAMTRPGFHPMGDGSS